MVPNLNLLCASPGILEAHSTVMIHDQVSALSMKTGILVTSHTRLAIVVATNEALIGTLRHL